jgi:hypothetical protein
MYDVIVIGARAAGAPTALLLARKGYRVLLIDKAAFPSDCLNNYYIHQPGIARLQHWGLLHQVIASGCPPIRQITFASGPVTLTGSPPPMESTGGRRPQPGPRRLGEEVGEDDTAQALEVLAYLGWCRGREQDLACSAPPWPHQGREELHLLGQLLQKAVRDPGLAAGDECADLRHIHEQHVVATGMVSEIGDGGAIAIHSFSSEAYRQCKRTRRTSHS